jgi:hypothetical protein
MYATINRFQESGGVVASEKAGKPSKNHFVNPDEMEMKCAMSMLANGTVPDAALKEYRQN